MLPTWMGNMSSLSTIVLAQNQLEGQIPIELCKLDYLSLLDLSENNFFGSVPSCFNSSRIRDNYIARGSFLAYLDTNSANIRGEDSSLTQEYYSVDIKEEVEFATKGRTYSYKGDILNYMSGIDLSCNRLTVFNVSHNNLSGSTPDRKNQFGTFDESMDHEGEEGGSFMDMGIFYISFVVAYIAVLLGIVAVLYINPYWRREWFNFIEVCIDTCYCFVVVHCRKLPGFKLA
uniref:Uncharacterized protein n=1 Tax=Fagus sylvatica TaxID=28930 RepID=A0A2N9GZN1_FAGSY